MNKLLLEKTIRLLSITCLFIYYSSARAQVITTIAGNGMMGMTGDGGPALLAELYLPSSIAFDTAGNLYLNTAGHTVRKVNTAGIITTYAGNGTYSPVLTDGVPATSTSVGVGTIVTDRRGNLYISDVFYNRIRKVDAAGIISTYAGTGILGYSGDGGPAINAKISWPMSMATDRIGNLYISTDTGNVVRKIDTAGIITTVAGNGMAGFSGDGGPATAASLNSPAGLTVDGVGNLFISDLNNSRVRKLDTSGIITTYAGNGTAGYSGDGGPATAAEFEEVYFLCADISGNLYIPDYLASVVRKVDAAGIITTIAGRGVPAWGGDGGPATAAYLATPDAVARYNNGNLYIADVHNERIRMISVAPYFINGHYQSAAFCTGTAMSLDTLLAANDSNSGVTEHWSLIASPHHGTASVAYAAVTTGSVVYPVGLTYTSTPGYVGPDTFTVRITDSIISDTTTIYVNVVPHPNAGAITGVDTVCIGSANFITLADTAAGGTWSASNSNAAVSAGTVVGVNAGIDTIRYIVSNVCGADTASHVVSVKHCPSSVPITTLQGELTLSPNPSKGTFTFMLSAPYREDVHITITNLEGEQVNEITTTTNNATEIILHVPAGAYLMRATTAHGAWNNEIVITR